MYQNRPPELHIPRFIFHYTRDNIVQLTFKGDLLMQLDELQRMYLYNMFKIGT